MIFRTGWLTCFTLAMIGLVAGCSGNTFGVKEVAYSDPQALSAGKVRIYVFREDSAFGGARKFSIIDNDTIVGVLTPGTFTHFTVDSGENEVVAYMSPSPIAHLRVSGREGETVYMFCHMGYASGIFLEEIDQAKAQSLMQTFKYTEIDAKGARAKMDYKIYYDNLYR